jgi:hypothetical protein
MTGRLVKLASHGKEVETKNLLLSSKRQERPVKAGLPLCGRRHAEEEAAAIAVVRILDGKRIGFSCDITLTSRAVGIIKLQFSRNVRSIATTWPDSLRMR